MSKALIGRQDSAYRVQFRNPDREAFVYFEDDVNETFGAGICRVPPSSSNEAHAHDNGDEIIYVISGEMRIVLDGESHILRQADAVIVQKGQQHQIFNNSSDAEMVHTFTFSPPEPASAIRRAYGRTNVVTEAPQEA